MTSLLAYRLPAETVPVPDTTYCVVIVGPHKVTQLALVGQRIFNTKCRLNWLTLGTQNGLPHAQ